MYVAPIAAGDLFPEDLTNLLWGEEFVVYLCLVATVATIFTSSCL